MTIACLLLLASRSVLAGPKAVAANYDNITIYQLEPKFMPAIVEADAGFPVTVTNRPRWPVARAFSFRPAKVDTALCSRYME